MIHAPHAASSCAGRQGGAPQLPQQVVRGDDRVRVVEQDRQQRALLDAAERDRAPAVADLQGPRMRKSIGGLRPTVPCPGTPASLIRPDLVTDYNGIERARTAPR